MTGDGRSPPAALPSAAVPLRADVAWTWLGLATFLITMVAPFGLARAIGPLSLLVAMVAGVALAGAVIFAFGRPQMVIAADGIRVEGGIQRGFGPYEEVVRVSRAERGHLGVEIITSSRGPVVLHPRSRSAADVDEVVSRIQAHLDAFRARDAGHVPGLERRGRSVAVWRADLAQAAAGHTTFREASLATDDLARALADPGAPIEQRVGAALALREVDAAYQEKIHAAIEATADPRVRVALVPTLEPEVDDDAVDAALREGARARAG